MKTTTPGAAQRWQLWQLLCRVLLAIVGGYATTALACMLLAQALVALGLERAAAVLWTTLSSFVLYTLAGLWAFHAQRLARVALVLLVMPALLAALRWALEGRA